MLQSLHGSHFDEGEAAKVWDIAENLERIQAEEAGYDPPDGEVGVDAFSGAVKYAQPTTLHCTKHVCLIRRDIKQKGRN